MKKIGLLFGSFNPVHLGHLAIAEYFVSQAGMDEVWLIVSPQNPLKNSADLIDEKHRLHMVKLAVEGNVRVLASDIEFSLERPSYTANTLRVLTEKFPQHAYTIILGEDIRASFHLWREYEWILSSFKIGFFPRNHPVPDPGLIEWNQFDAKLYDAPRMEISSTLIRHNFQHGISNRYLLSEEVLKYIEKQGLYG